MQATEMLKFTKNNKISLSQRDTKKYFIYIYNYLNVNCVVIMKT